MASAPTQRRMVGRALLVSAVAMFALGVAFWQGLFNLPPETRTMAAVGLAVVGLTDLGLGIFFLRQSR